MRVKITAFLLISILAVPWLQNLSWGPSAVLVQSVVAWCCWAVFGLLCVGINTTQDQVHASVVKAWGLAAVLSACIGLLQYFGAANGLQGVASAADVGQAYGNLRQRNQFATLMSVGLVALLWHAATANAHRGLPGATPSKVWALYLMAALLSAANAASGSRTGMLQWLLLAAVYGFWIAAKRQGLVRQLLAVSLLAYGLAAMLLPILLGQGVLESGILSRLQEASPACASRITLWANVLELIARKPLMGWGWGELDYAHFISPFRGVRFCGIVDNAHNLPLQLAVELGLPLAVLVCGLLLGGVLYAKPWREVQPSRQAAWAVLAVIGLHSMLEYPLWYAPFQGAVMAAVFFLCTKTEGLSNTFKKSKIAILSVGILAASVVVAFDYWRMSQIYLPLASRAQVFKTNAWHVANAPWLFKNLAVFAQLTTTALQRDNAAHVHAMALQLLHFSPEPRVIEKLIESAVMLGKKEESMFYLARYKDAFPAEAARWMEKHKKTFRMIDVQ